MKAGGSEKGQRKKTYRSVSNAQRDSFKQNLFILMFEKKMETVTTQGQTVEQRFKYLKVACAILWDVS